MSGELHFFEVDDGECVVEESVFEGAVDGSVGGHGGTAVDFDEPGFEGGVEHDVEAVEFEAAFVVGDDFGGGKEGLDDEFLDLEEGLFGLLLPVLREQVQPQLVQQVLPPTLLVVVLALLLHCHVGQVHL